MSEEEWRDIPGYEGYYQVSNLGQVRSMDRVITYRDGRVRASKGKKLKSRPSKAGGYPLVTLSRSSSTTSCYIHRLVLEAFVGPAPTGMECRHLDGNPENNSVENLKWGTRYENIHDQIRHGTHNKFIVRTHCPHGHEYTPENKAINRQGSPVCRTCRRQRERRKSKDRKVAA